MDAPPYLISTTLLLCERALVEADGVFSAIRIVDVAHAAEPVSATEGPFERIQLSIFAVIKATIGHLDEHLIELTLQNAVGEFTPLVATKMNFSSKMADAPPAVSLNGQLNLAVRNFGTCYVLLSLDGKEVARTPLTLLKLQEPVQLV